MPARAVVGLPAAACCIFAGKENCFTARTRSHRPFKLAIFLIFLLIFCISAFRAVTLLREQRRSAQAFEDLRQQVASEAPAPIASPAPASTSAPIPDPGFHRYDALYQQNPDFFGWVRIDDTRINYPVMHTPDDPEYYLRRAFDGTDSAAGVPFLDAACTADGLHWIVYGHHMDNGSMFADLTQYADESFWRDHPTIHFDTLNEPGEYQILAVFYAQAYHPEDTDVFRYYAYTDLSDPETYAEYLENVRDAALYDTGLTAAYGDPLLTLSTCSEHTTDGRFVVVAKKIEATNETL